MKYAAALFLCFLAGQTLYALDFWQYPEAADKNAVFLDLMGADLSFTDGFTVPPPEFRIDWVLPLGLPFSAGAFFKAPAPNLKSFGLRAAYHVNTGMENVDLYAVYVFDFGFLRNNILAEYGDEIQEVRYYDFRAGIRRRFGRFFCLAVETGFKLQGIHFGISITFN